MQKLFFNKKSGKLEHLSEKENDYQVEVGCPKKKCKKCHGTGRDYFYENFDPISLKAELLAAPCKCTIIKKKKEKQENPKWRDKWDILLEKLKQ